MVKPGGWHERKIGDCGEIITGATPRTDIATFWNGTIPWITPSDITEKQDIYVSERLITDKGLKQVRKLPADTLLVTCIASIGKNAILRKVGACNQQINAIIPSEDYDVAFLYYLMEYNKELLIINSGITATRILSKIKFGEISFLMPPLGEQRAIAAALSDTDALIDSLEKLIAKKQAIKQGAMQELLTGKRRLKGFSGEWKTISIGNCFEFKNGLNKAKEYFGSGTPIVNYMDVYKKTALRTNDIQGKVTLSQGEIRRYEVKKGDVFFTRTSETPEEVGIASVLLDDIPDCVFSGFVLRARPKMDILYDKYCQYCFSTVAVREQIISNCTYTTRALTNGNILSKITLVVPDKKEQIAITAILDDMDDEISALQKKLDKVRRIKQGMMAELLTGRIRLI